ncbi:MAG: hypothetical protein EZS28_027264 [Streblomastix strix]|uniref:Uncharacterized protein n=1 Tax=Streblomastix strix TaxID=222440 RepID=A0A5J4V398_9EUKA|nr:MAG: hypothetical protein EZS28_027264 [Streblomastix strix]
MFSALNSVDNPPAFREHHIVRVAVQVIIQVIAVTYVDVPFIILVMAGNKLSGYSSGSACVGGVIGGVRLFYDTRKREILARASLRVIEQKTIINEDCIMAKLLRNQLKLRLINLRRILLKE